MCANAAAHRAFLPEPTVGTTLERSSFILADPAAIELTRLRRDLFAIDKALVERVRVEGEMVANGREARRGFGICPCACLDLRVARNNVEIAGLSLPFAHRSARIGREVFHRDIGLRNVICRWVAGFECAECSAAVDQFDAVMDDLDASSGCFADGRARIVPHAFLSWTDWIGLGMVGLPHAFLRFTPFRGCIAEGADFAGRNP